jgi:uncharacterized protein (DUF2141 family)
MSKKSVFLVIFILVLCVIIPAAAKTASAVIHVKVNGIRPKQGGNLIFALYNSKENWLVLKKIYASRVVKVTQDSLTVDFENVPYGDSYALFVFHDANENNKLDFSWFPFPHPKEGVAVSNNAVRMGEPLYDKARFAVNNPECFIEIRMHY